MSMPPMILTLLGEWTNFDQLRKIADEDTRGFFQLDPEYSVLEPDERMPNAFKAAMDRTHPTMTDRDWEGIENHRAVAYIIVPVLKEEQKFGAAFASLMLVRELIRQNLVTAIKSDSSGIAHGLAEWKRLADAIFAASEAKNFREMAEILYRAWVRKLLDGGGFYYSCGMHILGKRDFIFEGDDEITAKCAMESCFPLALSDIRRSDGFPWRLEDPQEPIEIYGKDHPYYTKYGYYRIVSDEG